MEGKWVGSEGDELMSVCLEGGIEGLEGAWEVRRVGYGEKSGLLLRRDRGGGCELNMCGGRGTRG